MSNRIAGRIYIKVDGQQLEASGGVEAPATEVKRETLMGTTGPAGFKEEAQEPYVKGTFFFGPDFPLEKIATAIDMTITCEWPNGKVYTLSGAYLRGDVAAKSADGTVDLDFGGARGQWQ